MNALVGAPRRLDPDEDAVLDLLDGRFDLILDRPPAALVLGLKARETVAVAGLPKGVNVEISVIAVSD